MTRRTSRSGPTSNAPPPDRSSPRAGNGFTSTAKPRRARRLFWSVSTRDLVHVAPDAVLEQLAVEVDQQRDRAPGQLQICQHLRAVDIHHALHALQLEDQLAAD